MHAHHLAGLRLHKQPRPLAQVLLDKLSELHLQHPTGASSHTNGMVYHVHTRITHLQVRGWRNLTRALDPNGMPCPDDAGTVLCSLQYKLLHTLTATLHPNLGTAPARAANASRLARAFASPAARGKAIHPAAPPWPLLHLTLIDMTLSAVPYLAEEADALTVLAVHIGQLSSSGQLPHLNTRQHKQLYM